MTRLSAYFFGEFQLYIGERPLGSFATPLGSFATKEIQVNIL